jgi:Uncharacterized conserved protein
MKGLVLAALAFWCAIGSAQAQSSAGGPVTVTADNFNRAETDMYFAQFVKRGELGKFVHLRDLPVEGPGVRANRDTLYSEAVFDLDAGPVKITLPKAGKRFMTITAINENHYVFEVSYGPGNYTYNRAEVGTRYLFVALRILANPTDAQDMKQAQALQDAVVVKQKSPGRFEMTNWDPVSHKKVRDLLLALSTTLPDMQRHSGRKARSIRSAISSALRLPGAATRTRTSSTRTSGQPRTTAPPFIRSLSPPRCPSMLSGRSPSTMQRAVSRKTPTTPIRSTASPPSATMTALSQSSLVAVTARFRIACPP